MNQFLIYLKPFQYSGNEQVFLKQSSFTTNVQFSLVKIIIEKAIVPKN